MSRLRISLVTPSFNQARFIRRTIDSVLGQEGNFELEYRVVDGHSTDETLDILRSYGPRLTWTSERDGGQIDALNKGLAAATGDVVGWLNSDDLLLPGALGRVADEFARNPHAEWVHGRCRIIDGQDWPIRAWISLYKHLRARRHSFENLLTENYICQMTAFWRRAVHAEIGYLDNTLPLAFDYDLFVRLARRGPPLYIGEPTACFRWYDTSKSGAGYQEQLREAVQVAERYAGDRRWTLVRTRAKNAATANIYRVLSAARTALRRNAP